MTFKLWIKTYSVCATWGLLNVFLFMVLDSVGTFPHEWGHWLTASFFGVAKEMCIMFSPLEGFTGRVLVAPQAYEDIGMITLIRFAGPLISISLAALLLYALKNSKFMGAATGWLVASFTYLPLEISVNYQYASLPYVGGIFVASFIGTMEALNRHIANQTRFRLPPIPPELRRKE